MQYNLFFNEFSTIFSATPFSFVKVIFSSALALRGKIPVNISFNSSYIIS